MNTQRNPAISTLAELKRKLVVGSALTMLRHDWFPNLRFIGVTRRVSRKQTNGVWLIEEDGKESFLEWRKASDTLFTPDGFGIRLGDGTDEWILYQIDQLGDAS